MAWYATRGQFHPPPARGQWPEPSQSLSWPETWDAGDQKITALAAYDITATVLSTERYYIDNGSSLSPVDFAMGWGPMSDLDLARQLGLSQGGRWFRYRLPNGRFPLTYDEINSHSANVHIRPASEAVRERVLSVRAGDVVHMTGKLVEATSGKGGNWRSSLSRTDTGAGACEVFWVERIDWQ